MPLHIVRKGLDVPLAGAPTQDLDGTARAPRVGVLAADAVGLKPEFLVQVGERVLRGTPLFEDRRNRGVRTTAPAAGTVVAIHRGAMRAFESLVIDVAADDSPAAQVVFSTWQAGVEADALTSAQVRALLQESGLWTALRTRPFSKVPAASASPHALFITAIDTRPHAPHVELVLRGRDQDFAAGCRALAKLAPRTYLCVADDSAIDAPVGSGIAIERFRGPHPAGLPGTHMHLVDPADPAHPAWHVGYQDVAAIGHLVQTGRLDVARVITVGGPAVARPRHVRTRLGASTDALLAGELTDGAARVISGSVLDGRIAAGDVHGYLGRHHLQLAALPEGRRREPFGWIAPAPDKYSLWGVVLGHWRRNGGLPLTTSTNGGVRAMVPIGGYERVLPLDMMATFLLRTLLTGDVERAEALGALELDEEDLALCTFVCPGKHEYGPLLRATLARLEKEA